MILSSHDAIFQQAKAASLKWKRLTVRERLIYLDRLGAILASQAKDWVSFLVQSQHKTQLDALSADVYATLEAIRYLRKIAPRELQAQRLRPSFFSGSLEHAEIWREPYGVTAIAGPWNFPLQLAMIPAFYALVTGNVVILKPSEKVPGIARLMESLIDEAKFPAGVFQVVEGGAETFQSIIQMNPDFVFVTGGPVGGRKIYEQCATRLIPCIFELSGKDSMIVFPDANLRRTAKAAAWGAMLNSGQVCFSTEFLYIHEQIADSFIPMVVKEVASLTAGSPTSDLHGMANRDAWNHARNLLLDALERGANMLHGYVPSEEQFPYFPPIVLTKVDASMRLWNEELFAPILPIVLFHDQQGADVLEAMSQLNYGLGVSLFTRNVTYAKQFAEHLGVGNVSINNVSSFILRMDLPFGGVKQSGFGRYRGVAGIHHFTYLKSVTYQNGRAARALPWFPDAARSYAMIRRLIHWLWSKRGGSK